jgi:hypothetical protein
MDKNDWTRTKHVGTTVKQVLGCVAEVIVQGISGYITGLSYDRVSGLASSIAVRGQKHVVPKHIVDCGHGVSL